MPRVTQPAQGHHARCLSRCCSRRWYCENLDNLNIAIVETLDTIDPIINWQIDYNNGYVRINTSEIVDVTPSVSTVDLSKLKLVNTAGDDIFTSISTYPNLVPCQIML